MMNIIEEAIIYATIMHQGKTRKFGNRSFILHPLEVAQILSAMTDDMEVIAAGILHDVVEDTDGTLPEIEKRFGKRVADLVASESEQEFPGEDRRATWQRRKEASLISLKNSRDIGVKMLWLADKLANIRSLAGEYSEEGEKMWQALHQSDSQKQKWYYQSIAEILELSLNKTGAFKEFIMHINFIWPKTFDSRKTRYREYRKASLEGRMLLGSGAKGDVYRYDDELVIKVFNENNTYHDVEREIALSRKALIMGIPTAISFGIVSVGDRYGAMYELVDSDTMSGYIAQNPGLLRGYAKRMAKLAHTIHGIEASKEDGFPDALDRLRSYVRGGLMREDEALADKCLKLNNGIPVSKTLVHGDFHTGNVFIQNGEPLLIDMDRLAMGDPIVEISDLYYFYVALGEDEQSCVEEFMGFAYQTAREFFECFLEYYLETKEDDLLCEVTQKASLIGHIRIINKLWKNGAPSEEDRKIIDRCMNKIALLVERIDTLTW